MRIALAQMKNSGSMKANLDKSMELIKEAAENKANLILFPEVQLTEFFPQYEGCLLYTSDAADDLLQV